MRYADNLVQEEQTRQIMNKEGLVVSALRYPSRKQRVR